MYSSNTRVKMVNWLTSRGGHCQHGREKSGLGSYRAYLEKDKQTFVGEKNGGGKEIGSSENYSRWRNLDNKENDRTRKMQKTEEPWGKNHRSLGSLTQLLMNPPAPQQTCNI